MRLNMLAPCLPLEYPLNVYVDVFDARQASEYEELASLAESGEWEAVLRYVEDHHHLINTSPPIKKTHHQDVPHHQHHDPGPRNLFPHLSSTSDDSCVCCQAQLWLPVQLLHIQG